MRALLTGGVCLGLATATAALAQPAQPTATASVEVKTNHGGATTGAAAGAAVGGPLGAVVGALAGATVHHAVAPPGDVRAYVTTQTVDSVSYRDRIVVGRTVDGDVVWREVPDYPKYRWAYLNGARVVIDADTHRVLAIY